MFDRPLDCQGKCPARQAAADHFERPDVDQGFVFGVKRMEMRRGVFAQNIWMTIPKNLL